MDLENIAKELRIILDEKRLELGLEFFEDEHKYLMKDVSGVVKDNFPSVSKVLKKFYKEFPTDEAAYNKAKGDLVYAEQLKKEWAQAGFESTNLGSRTHFFLESDLINRNGDYKEVRQPIFECDIFQQAKSDAMIRGGKKYLDLSEQRGLVLLDTEMVLGHPELGYTGQPDKVWLTPNATGDGFGLLITDWKTNKEKNFKSTPYTKPMYHPFDTYPNTSLGHYYLQLPFYGKLILKMLEGTKYENIKLLGCIVVLLKDDSDFEEFRVPKDIINKILDMNMKQYLD